ncbi:sialate O-acetylesterase [Neotamlana nanhaiensis]|uniref:sialate O-acetylesterase n=1 Tax=Neotamlana nanhaiensis TaxID=1382798 RepID=UPI000A97AEC4|nr:sialate O-acetylesterase [Tamlana nanhaiensis]
MNTILKFFTLIIFTLNLVLNAQIKLPKLVSDGMVLQRDQPIKIWGCAAPNENISISFKSENYSTKANNNGKWAVSLPAQDFGRPFTMTLKASNTITINDILIGDVWVCSGQSNMELTMDRVSDKYQNVIDKANYSEIRQFLVPDRYNFNNESEDFESGEWIAANPESVMDFSAVAFFFAQNIYEKHHIPIGLINSALGGSPVES